MIREAVIAAALTGLMILLFLGSWRSTLIIAISIPLSILTSVIVLGFLGETINIMTLGGLALAVGMLVDDATVTIENIERYLEEGHDLREAILEGAGQIAVPALVSTLCICIVFLPMFFLGGVARYLFVPLAEAVVFAMLASYILSRTLVPTLAMYLLKAEGARRALSQSFGAFPAGIRAALRTAARSLSRPAGAAVRAAQALRAGFSRRCLCAFLLVPFLGQDFFPNTDSGQFILHVRAKTGTRIEETARLCDLVENSIGSVIPAGEIGSMLDNIGMPYSQINTEHMTNGTIGAGDADVMVSLKENHHPTAGYVRRLRKRLPGEFPGTTFYFLPADIVTQILNFGLPAPIDVQIEGADINGNRTIADRILQQLQQVPGLVDLRLQQPDDYPVFDVKVDRTKAGQGGYTEHDVAVSMLNTLSGSFQTQPMFFLNCDNGVNYSLVAQTPQYEMQSLQDLKGISITAGNRAETGDSGRRRLGFARDEMAVISHYNIRRVLDIYGAVQGRDLGAVAADVHAHRRRDAQSAPRQLPARARAGADDAHILYRPAGRTGIRDRAGLSAHRGELPVVAGSVHHHHRLPAALGGIVLFLFATHTTLSVPALMGAIMCMGVATANSILVVSFAKERLEHHVMPPAPRSKQGPRASVRF